MISECIIVYETQEKEGTKSSFTFDGPAHQNFKTSFLILNFTYKALKLRTYPISLSQFSEKRNLVQVREMKRLIMISHPQILINYLQALIPYHTH